MKTNIIGVALVGTLLVSLTACGSSDNFRDVKGVHNRHPDVIVNYDNMDKHPNLGFLCVAGIPLITTTRDYNAVTVVPYSPGTAYAYKVCAQHELDPTS